MYREIQMYVACDALFTCICKGSDDSQAGRVPIYKDERVTTQWSKDFELQNAVTLLASQLFQSCSDLRYAMRYC